MVVGGGDSAVEEATFLTKFARTVTVVHRRDKLRASKIMQDRAMKNEKISFAWNSVVEHSRKGCGHRVRLKNIVTGASTELTCAGVFVAIGHRPNTDLLKGQVAMDEKGLRPSPRRNRHQRGGLFAAGDVQDSKYRQAITAAGSGCMAAIDAERFLESVLHQL